VELYRAGLLGNLTTMYVTDSIAFRLYAGTNDEASEFMHVQVVEDHFRLTKMQDGAYARAMGRGLFTGCSTCGKPVPLTKVRFTRHEPFFTPPQKD